MSDKVKGEGDAVVASVPPTSTSICWRHGAEVLPSQVIEEV